jgi:hypothetical protein
VTRLDPADEAAVASHLQQNLARSVGLEVWTRQESVLVRSDRDRCVRCDDVVELAKQIAVELMVAPYDPYSVHMSRLVLSLGVESKNVRVQVTNASEFPLLAQRRAITEVPLLFLNQRRYVGAWDEEDLVEQIRRIAAGDDDPVIRERIPTSPFMTDAEAQRAQPQQPTEKTSPGGIILPGQ